jgi:hypothetical protein
VRSQSLRFFDAAPRRAFRMDARALRTATADRARRTAELIALCRSPTARGSETILALSDARARLDEATRAHAAEVRVLGVPRAEAMRALRAELAAVDSGDLPEFGLVCDEVVSRFLAALDAA